MWWWKLTSVQSSIHQLLNRLLPPFGLEDHPLLHTHQIILIDSSTITRFVSFQTIQILRNLVSTAVEYTDMSYTDVYCTLGSQAHTDIYHFGTFETTKFTRLEYKCTRPHSTRSPLCINRRSVLMGFLTASKSNIRISSLFNQPTN